MLPTFTAGTGNSPAQNQRYAVTRAARLYGKRAAANRAKRAVAAAADDCEAA